jgi:DNA mismatch endonuclease (patch repair protein)
MADVKTPELRSRNMAAIKGKDTKPEMIVRKYLFSRGLRFRVQVRRLPGTPDIVLPKYKTVIFVNGCFWHGHERCKYFRLPKSNVGFWEEKIERNVARDARNEAERKPLDGALSRYGSAKSRPLHSERNISNAFMTALSIRPNHTLSDPTWMNYP